MPVRRSPLPRDSPRLFPSPPRAAMAGIQLIGNRRLAGDRDRALETALHLGVGGPPVRIHLELADWGNLLGMDALGTVPPLTR